MYYTNKRNMYVHVEGVVRLRTGTKYTSYITNFKNTSNKYKQCISQECIYFQVKEHATTTQ